MTSRMTSVAVMVACLCVCGSVLPIATARSADGFSRMERLLTSLRGPAESSGESAHPLEKRQIYDHSCKGVYDRSLFSKLEHVCDDCYNLYRTSYVASACRSNCYSNLVFRQCIDDLLLMDVFDEYAKAIQVVGRKK
uniref:Crustacean hyperglycemic hormone n=1 Tax=Ocypode quadrata TaxID=53310 RepID=A0A172B133_OCYQU|nr:crustacean hyperglycemic hormone precursor [Ocypode quadrata]